MRIFKYKMTDNECQLRMPIGAQFLSVQCQFDEICLWMEVPDVSTGGPEVERTFIAIGTGHLFNERGLKYLGTVQQAEGRLIWHIFEREISHGKSA
jgi:hypothetical protein